MKKCTMQFLLLALPLFVMIIIGCGKVNKMQQGSINTFNDVEDVADTKSYLVKNDGSKVYGSRVNWQNGILLKKQIGIDNQKFNMSEISGYKVGNWYFAKYKNEYIQRIIKGRINVYIRMFEKTNVSTNSSGFTNTSSTTVAEHFAQRGDAGQLIRITDLKDIAELMNDCAAAVKMLSISSSQVRKELKKNANFINSIFDFYNNGCK